MNCFFRHWPQRWLAALACLGLWPAPAAQAVLTFDLRVEGGGKKAYVRQLGEIVRLELFAVVESTPNGTGEEAFYNGFGSLESTYGGNLLGSWQISLERDYAANGSSPGVPVDLDADGDLDAGSLATAINSQFFFARRDPQQSLLDPGTTIPEGREFRIATAQFEILGLGSTLDAAAIGLNFTVPQFVSPIQYEALWMEDGIPRNAKGGNGGTLPLAGAPVYVHAVPELSSTTMFGSAVLMLAGLPRWRTS